MMIFVLQSSKNSGKIRKLFSIYAMFAISHIVIFKN